MLNRLQRKKRVLFAIQGTGNGHISRAKEILPLLKKNADVDLLVSGTQNEIDWDEPIKYKFNGLGFVFGKQGGIDWIQTIKQMNFWKFLHEVSRLDVTNYDLVINDFEPVSSWACKFANVACVALSHQSALLNLKTPKPKKQDWMGKMILKHYAPSDYQYSFHFKPYGKGIYTPVIRKEIRNITPTNNNHITVYLPAYGDTKLLQYLEQFESCTWEIFSKRAKKSYQHKNCKVVPISGEAFSKSMAESAGVLCGAGFETPAEALFLGKKLMVVPMDDQYEQLCNATALKKMGVPVIYALSRSNKSMIESWIQDSESIQIEYPDLTEKILTELLSQTLENEDLPEMESAEEWLSPT